MPKHTPTDHFRDDPLLEELADELLDCGAVLSQIISRMVRFSAQGHAPPDAAPIPDVARELVASVLGGAKLRYSRRDLKVAAAIVGEATAAISEEILFVDLDRLGAADDEDPGEDP